MVEFKEIKLCILRSNLVEWYILVLNIHRTCCYYWFCITKIIDLIVLPVIPSEGHLRDRIHANRKASLDPVSVPQALGNKECHRYSCVTACLGVVRLCTSAQRITNTSSLTTF